MSNSSDKIALGLSFAYFFMMSLPSIINVF